MFLPLYKSKPRQDPGNNDVQDRLQKGVDRSLWHACFCGSLLRVSQPEMAGRMISSVSWVGSLNRGRSCCHSWVGSWRSNRCLDMSLPLSETNIEKTVLQNHQVKCLYGSILCDFARWGQDFFASSTARSCYQGPGEVSSELVK